MPEREGDIVPAEDCSIAQMREVLVSRMTTGAETIEKHIVFEDGDIIEYLRCASEFRNTPTKIRIITA